MLARLLPRTCSSLSVFLCYSHEQRAVAEEIAQALTNVGHSVFFDLDSIPTAAEYNERIHQAIESADRFVFLASQEALAPGKFTLSELQFAKERWPSPAGKVWPVIVDPRVSIADLPTYLRSVSVLSVAGNAPAEVVAAIHKTRETGRFCKTVTLASGMAVLAAAAYAGLGFQIQAPPTEVVLLPPEKIHFRSKAEAPLRANDPAADGNWADSPLTITVMPVAYNHRTEPGRRARIFQETVDFVVAGASQAFRALYVVEITDAPCGDRWFCIKGNAGPETLEPGRSISRETLFIPAGSEAPTWRKFVDTVLSSPDLPVTVTYRAKVEVSEDAGLRRLDMRADCRIDTQLMRRQLEAAGFRAADNTKPVFLEPDCLPVPGATQ